jgi:predicted acetyltransferase
MFPCGATAWPSSSPGPALPVRFISNSRVPVDFRQAETSDIRAVAELWVHSFPGPHSLEDRMRVLETGGRYGGIETAMVAEENGRLAAALKLTPFTQFIAGAALPMMGLAAVGVAPWARRRGVGIAVCTHALDVARRRGDVVSALYPFRPAFYHRLGWGLVGQLHTYRFMPEQLPDRGDPRVRLATTDDHEAIAACYDRVARASNGMIERDGLIWKQRFDGGMKHAYVTEGTVDGYMIVRYGRASSADRRPLRIIELVAEHDDTCGRLLGWISRQRDLWRRIIYDAMPGEHFGLRLLDPRPPGFAPARWLWASVATVIRGPMLRILDVRRALELRAHWPAHAPCSFDLVVDDSQLPSNAGPWRCSFDGSRMRVTALAGAAAMDAEHENGEAQRVIARLRITAPALAQIYTGEIAVSDAVRLGAAQCDGDATALDALFAPLSPFRLLDEF